MVRKLASTAGRVASERPEDTLPPCRPWSRHAPLAALPRRGHARLQAMLGWPLVSSGRRREGSGGVVKAANLRREHGRGAQAKVATKMTVRILVGDARRRLRKDGALWLNPGSRFAGSAPPHRAPERGTGYTEPSGCRDPDCACSGLCGECQGVLRDHYRSACNGSHGPSQAPPACDPTCQDTGRQDSTAPATSPPGAQVSSTPQSSPQPPGGCWPGDTPEASSARSAPDSWHHGAPACACRGCGRGIPDRERRCRASSCRSGMGFSSLAWGNSTIAPHKPKDLINMPVPRWPESASTAMPPFSRRWR